MLLDWTRAVKLERRLAASPLDFGNERQLSTSSLLSVLSLASHCCTLKTKAELLSDKKGENARNNGRLYYDYDETVELNSLSFLNSSSISCIAPTNTHSCTQTYWR